MKPKLTKPQARSLRAHFVIHPFAWVNLTEFNLWRTAPGLVRAGLMKTRRATGGNRGGKPYVSTFGALTEAGRMEVDPGRLLASQHKPQSARFKREWLELHRQHLRALRLMRAGGPRWHEHAYRACKLADAKYEIFNKELKARMGRAFAKLGK